MKTIKAYTTAVLVAAFASVTLLSGCISIKKEEPDATTTTVTRSSTVTPSTTTVQRTTY